MPLGDRILCRETGFPFPAWLLMQVGTEGEGQGPPAVSQQLQHHHRLPLLPEHFSPLLQSKGTFINGINAADLLGARLPAEAAQGKKRHQMTNGKVVQGGEGTGLCADKAVLPKPLCSERSLPNLSLNLSHKQAQVSSGLPKPKISTPGLIKLH